MKRISKHQAGASAVGTIIFLAVIGYGIYVGIQYVPQFIESSSVDSILDSLEINQREEPADSVQDVESRIKRLLDVNEMKNMEDSFDVRQDGNSFIVEVSYERELNLLYEVKKMKYEKTITLN